MGDVKKSKYGYSREVALPYEEAVARVTETLKEQGFGILTEIDVKATLKKKLDKDFTKYVILGACNPNLAFRALSGEIDIGLLLPCNVTVYERPGDGKTVVSVLDPETMVSLTQREDIGPLAQEARDKVVAALRAI
jgi:uncharacterized protein (DUF302 family)